MLDVAGQDASEAFEDVGHSDEARESLDKLLVGVLKRQVSVLLRATVVSHYTFFFSNRVFSPLLHLDDSKDC